MPGKVGSEGDVQVMLCRQQAGSRPLDHHTRAHFLNSINVLFWGTWRSEEHINVSVLLFLQGVFRLSASSAMSPVMWVRG